jgi:multimeric flavodoxin WrbA
MRIVGIVGSPRKDGRTNALVEAALSGAQGAGAELVKVHLTDYAIRPFTGTGDSREAAAYCPEELSTLCREAQGLVVGAPVYWGDISGITKDFMDTVRLPHVQGVPGLGIAIAGGSGKGLLSGVQSIYHFFYHKQMRCIEPVPVSRFNMEAALATLPARGAELVRLAADAKPFEGATVDERWIDCTAYYGDVRYMRGDPVDEFVLLAQQMVALGRGAQGRGGDKLPLAQAELRAALTALAEGHRAEAGRCAVRCYHLLYF